MTSIIPSEDQEFLYELKIPKDRIAVLVGKKGEVKRAIEEETKTKIAVDSREGEVQVSGKDALLLLNAREIIKAIARGFNPEVTFSLLKQDNAIEFIRLSDFAKTRNDIKRLNGRIIGKNGKARKVIEDLTEVKLCVYGKTIGYIGTIEQLAVARRAIVSLLEGSSHRNVFRFLEKHKKKVMAQETKW